MKAFFQIVVMALALLACSRAGANHPGLVEAERVIELIRTAQYQSAANAFLYPAGYGGAERRTESASLASALEALFETTGKLVSAPVNQLGAFVVIKITLRAGDRDHPLPRREQQTSASYRFSTPFEKYKDAAVNIELDYVGERWQVRELAFALPASDPSTSNRLQTLMRRMREARSPSE